MSTVKVAIKNTNCQTALKFKENTRQITISNIYTLALWPIPDKNPFILANYAIIFNIML